MVVNVEGLMNSRPLSYQSADASDLVPLTPNNFLFGMAGAQVAAESVDTEDFHIRQRWRRVQELVRHVWERWLRECVPMLTPRSKWRREMRPVAVGDVVLVIQQDSARGRWPLGRIQAVFPGADGYVRAVDVLVQGTTYRRPIVRICPLELP